MALSDKSYMRRALALARRGERFMRPNPRVGAIVVKDGSIVGSGWHRLAGGAHAEIEALQQAGNRAEGATLYVTLEPCNHQGKTGPCTEAIVSAKIKRVVIAMRDPNTTVPGGGVERLQSGGIEVVTGIEEVIAKEINPAWLHSLQHQLPYVAAVSVLSLNGSPVKAEANLRLRRLRKFCDAEILTDRIVMAGKQPDIVIFQHGRSEWLELFKDLNSKGVQFVLCTSHARVAELFKLGLLNELCVIRTPTLKSGELLFGAFDLLTVPKLKLKSATLSRGEAVTRYSFA